MLQCHAEQWRGRGGPGRNIIGACIINIKCGRRNVTVTLHGCGYSVRSKHACMHVSECCGSRNRKELARACAVWLAFCRYCVDNQAVNLFINEICISLKIHGPKDIYDDINTFHGDPRPSLWRLRAPADSSQ